MPMADERREHAVIAWRWPTRVYLAASDGRELKAKELGGAARGAARQTDRKRRGFGAGQPTNRRINAGKGRERR